MVDRVPKSELDLLREEVAHLRREVEELRAGPPPKPEKRSWWNRLRGKLFGRLVYKGPMTCGHCIHRCIYKRTSDGQWWVGGAPEGRLADKSAWGCELLQHDWNRNDGSHEACNRFKPRRQYMTRERG